MNPRPRRCERRALPTELAPHPVGRFPLTARDSPATLPGIIGCGGDGEKVSVRHFLVDTIISLDGVSTYSDIPTTPSQSMRPLRIPVIHHSITLHRRMGSATVLPVEYEHAFPPLGVFLRHTIGPPAGRDDAPVRECERPACQRYRLH